MTRNLVRSHLVYPYVAQRMGEDRYNCDNNTRASKPLTSTMAKHSIILVAIFGVCDLWIKPVKLGPLHLHDPFPTIRLSLTS